MSDIEQEPYILETAKDVWRQRIHPSKLRTPELWTKNPAICEANIFKTRVLATPLFVAIVARSSVSSAERGFPRRPTLPAS
jgi:hypothetical protein